MTDNAQKTPFGRSLNTVADDAATDAIRTTGRALPASVVARNPNGTIVTVKFEVNSVFTIPNVTVPVLFPEYVRWPIKVGDRGMVIPADAYLGGMSGLGGGVADLSQRANLTALAFAPLGNTAFTADVDQAQVTLYGPNGVTLRDASANTVLTVLPNSVVVTIGGTVMMSITSDGIALNGTVTIDGRQFLTHHHSGVQPGGGNTGNVV